MKNYKTVLKGFTKKWALMLLLGICHFSTLNAFADTSIRIMDEDGNSTVAFGWRIRCTLGNGVSQDLSQLLMSTPPLSAPQRGVSFGFKFLDTRSNTRHTYIHPAWAYMHYEEFQRYLPIVLPTLGSTVTNTLDLRDVDRFLNYVLPRTNDSITDCHIVDSQGIRVSAGLQ